MEEQNKFLKLLYLVAFVALAGVSCWATAESLHMLLESFPYAFCWVITIAFFIIASFGTKLIVDSLNQNVYVEKRGAKLILGIVITLVFWLVCSMPTNTHTFFYRSVANSIAFNDIQTTEGYLDQLISNSAVEKQIVRTQQQLIADVTGKQTELENEIDRPADPGFGPNAKNILYDLGKILGNRDITEVPIKGNSKQERKNVKQQYKRIISGYITADTAAIRANMTSAAKSTYQADAKTAKDNLRPVENAITANPSALNNVHFAHNVDSRLIKGYAIISTYANFVNFKSMDKDKYVTEHPVTKLKRLMSVFDVWHDVLTGQYKGHGFIFWILISILVDIAAFIFFDLTFKKRED